ncbi:alpha-ribazole phosphatase [Clostridium saccharoperbutylacetonicum]|jgi:alpha-ribazole phosphatase|uniref:Fructose-2,6-bisphosphatase n=1 Tax=Clostridium saccharoperbutylacetonicum N1-4(HMT) TaxID=931276 RepID=M1MUP5_9CLOT|nr:histidine phosphatase family protein [Clostridium saccharoperbutylacetonicum]AGF55237.1 fructose-2,6-bisphosphatase [Clostridium saccharoperbutylacetonicum N1-4(HMT)]NRT64052.1 alpha-ribazole phosphatase [Clostridium saccharoperbutylacetonicum]NSB27419.1 alpha-ribazole phosphatase [Clostridium saccharoperbutylacetonicum]NSB40908.1 alpha-ribazole phosphatase [Clostridium saccharoperbutylacetonicum]
MREIKVYLIRHGKTYCNEKQLYCGKSDVELSENGIKELKNISEKYKFHKCDFYFTSGAKRANQTMEILCSRNKYNVFDKLFEYDFGDFELKSYEDLKALKEYTAWIEDIEGKIKCPNGENKLEFRNRIKEGFIELINLLYEENINTAFGVLHGGSIGMLLEMLYDDSKKFYEWQPKNGEGYELIIDVLEKNKFKISKVRLV